MLCGTIYNSTKLIPLNEFLTNHKVDKAPISHTSMTGGKYYIPEEKNTEFLEIYNRDILEANIPYHLVERHSEYGPVVIDLDVKYKSDTSKRGYTIEVLEQIMQIYMKYLEKYISINDTNRKGYILEKKKPTFIEKDQEYKDGVHIFFPDIITKPNIQELIREKVINHINKTDLFDYIDNTNDLNDIFDKSVIKSNGMFLYGSMKPDQKRPYKLTHIYQVYPDKTEKLDIVLNPKEILFNISLRKKTSNASKMIMDDEDIERLLPENKVKADIKCKKEVMMKQENKTEVVENKSTNIIQFIGDIDLATENINKIKFSIKLVDLLKIDRVEEYKSWYNLGICLHNISSNLPIHKNQIDNWNKYSNNKTPGHLLLNKWIEISSKSSKYNNGECEKIWDKMNYMEGGLTYYTLRYWAKEDNLYSYNKLCKNSVDVELPKVLSYKKGNVPSYELARIVHLCYADEFVCSSIKHKIWYKFDNHQWSKSDSGIHLRQLLSTQVRSLFIQYRQEYGRANQEAELNNDSIKAKIYLEQMKNCISISEKLSTTAYKASVMTELHDLFYNGEFDEKLDSNVNLISFNNGVYDLEHASFRPGLPEDYLSFSTGINYIPYNPENQIVLDIYTFLSQILPKPAVREYVITTLSSFLSGKTSDEKFHIWTGCHSKNSEILMSNGDIKKVQDVKLGDSLMGDDSTPRIVKKLHTGIDEMYQINTSKGHQFTVNKDHILCIKATEIGSIYNCKKENRIKVLWQEKDLLGYPTNVSKNFPYKSNTKKVYRKNVFYYNTQQEALQAAEDFKDNLKNNENYIRNNDIIEIPVKEFVKIQNKIGKRNYYIYSNGVDFEHNAVDLDPYILGYWIGDGNSNSSAITTMDNEVIEYFNNTLKLNATIHNKNKTAKTYYYSNGRGKSNYFFEFLKNNNLINNKHIPFNYKTNSKKIRLELLAGLIDSDGHYQKKSNQYEITLKQEHIIDDIVYIALSLGFASKKKQCTKSWISNGEKKYNNYYNCIIYGNGIENIPVLLDRKKAYPRNINKNATKYSFNIKKIDNDKYYGFTVDKNHRYLTSDFICHHNCGGNGKSKLIELFSMSLGEYKTNLPISLLTQKRGSSSSASPELSKTKGKRFACLQEPDHNEKINVGLMKELTGGDMIEARALYSEPIEFKPQFKLILTCNSLPEMPPEDEGTWRRVRLVEFISKFVKDPNPKNQWEFPIDTELTSKLSTWKEAFMSILVHYYINVYKKQGLNEPEDVLEVTNNYKKVNDFYSEFIDNVIIENPKGKLHVPNAVRLFKNWFKESGCSSDMPKQKKFTTYMDKRYGKPKDNFWKGICVKKEIENEIIEDDE